MMADYGADKRHIDESLKRIEKLLDKVLADITNLKIHAAKTGLVGGLVGGIGIALTKHFLGI